MKLLLFLLVMGLPIILHCQQINYPKDASDLELILIMERDVHSKELYTSENGTYLISANFQQKDPFYTTKFVTLIYFKVSTNENVMCAMRPVLNVIDGTITDSIDVGIATEHYGELDSIYTVRIKKDRMKVPNDNAYYEAVNFGNFGLWIVDRVKVSWIMENDNIIARINDYEFK